MAVKLTCGRTLGQLRPADHSDLIPRRWLSGQKNVLSGRWHSETIDLHRSHEAFMAETTKLSVEKALNKLREADTPKSKTTRMNEEIEALDEEASRLREQRLRLERHQRRSTKED
jgi:hypothetical protein